MAVDEKSGFENFLSHFAVLAPAIKELEAKGLSREYIARLLEFVAGWLRAREDK